MEPSIQLHLTVRNRWTYRMQPTLLSVVLPRRTVGAHVLMKNRAPMYVGRSDHCLLTRLRTHPFRGRATHVTFEPRRTCEAAFQLESAWFHILRPEGWLLNKVHPARPTHALTQCPFCTPGDHLALCHALARAPNPQCALKKQRLTIQCSNEGDRR